VNQESVLQKRTDFGDFVEFSQAGLNDPTVLSHTGFLTTLRLVNYTHTNSHNSMWCAIFS